MMKIKKWIIGILGILLAEIILILLLSAITPIKMVVRGDSRTILQSAVPQYTDNLQTYDTSNNSRKNNTEDATQNKNNKKSQQVKKIYNRNKKLLVLVNKKQKLDNSYAASLTPICHGRLYASQHLYEPLVQMLADAQKQGYRFWIASAYRSREKQQRLIDEDVQLGMKKGLSYQEALQQTYKETMPAGYSEHETGLALDILCSENTNMDTSQAEEPANMWLQENCHRYGFILRYPKEKEYITEISYEPWHFRYVGKEAATYMAKHSMALEEFWEQLNKHQSSPAHP